jgi:hypothetical protein
MYKGPRERASSRRSVRPSPLPALPLSERELCGDVRIHLLQQNLSLFGVDPVTGSKSPPNRTSA